MLKQRAAKRPARNLNVKAVTDLTPNMRRITLAGDDLEGFPPNSEGNYFKLLFDNGAALRTFTVAEQRSEDREIDVDFVLHGVCDGGGDGELEGLAAPWAAAANVGDSIQIAGPGNARFINVEADWFLLAADMTALPALSANLKRLPADSQGVTVVEVISEADKQDLPAPAGIDVQWVINPNPGADNTPLVDAVKAVPWRMGQVATWCACEFKSMQQLRLYLKNDKQVVRSHLYLSSYWKRGLSESQHKVVKKQDQIAAGM